MEKLINLGNFLVSKGSKKSLDPRDVEGFLEKLGSGWRICTSDELKYLSLLKWKLDLKDLPNVKESDLYKTEETKENNYGLYIDREGVVESVNIPHFYGGGFPFDYIFVKDI